MTNYFGDIPIEDLEMLAELKALEKWFIEHGKTIKPVMAAKGFTAMAFDYYEMYMDEEAERLVNRAEKEHPGYFKGPIYTHMAQDWEFEALINMLIGYPQALELLQSFGYDEQI